MRSIGAYGETLGERFLLEKAPAIVTRSLRQTEIAATQIRSDNPSGGLSGDIPREDAFLIGLQICDFPNHHYWEDGKKAPVTSLRSGDSVIYDLKRGPAVLMDKPFHSLHFYLSRNALNELADDVEARRITDLNYSPGLGIQDPTIMNLGSSLLAAFETPAQVSRLFMEHVTMAVAAHVAQTYGGMRPHAMPSSSGGLAPWQEKKAKEIFGANLGGQIGLKEVAQECGLSISHFSRAFRRSMGLAPHMWLIQRRLDEAKNLLMQRKLSLSEVALACGFADQSHFTRVFTRRVGQSPGVWRRNLD